MGGVRIVNILGGEEVALVGGGLGLVLAELELLLQALEPGEGVLGGELVASLGGLGCCGADRGGGGGCCGGGGGGALLEGGGVHGGPGGCLGHGGGDHGRGEAGAGLSCSRLIVFSFLILHLLDLLQGGLDHDLLGLEHQGDGVVVILAGGDHVNYVVVGVLNNVISVLVVLGHQLEGVDVVLHGDDDRGGGVLSRLVQLLELLPGLLDLSVLPVHLVIVLAHSLATVLVPLVRNIPNLFGSWSCSWQCRRRTFFGNICRF